MNRLFLFGCFLLFGLSSFAREIGTSCNNGVDSIDFASPFDFNLYLSANFGELRSNHFHGGLDIKTQGVEGKALRSVADGYISRVSVSPGGYGNALYVTHDNGYTSVYGHMQAFVPVVAEIVKDHQYRNETFAVDTFFASGRFPVSKGEVIGWAGNSGYSFGPHLHLEIRKTDTNEPVDPLPFFKSKIKDTTSPRATAIKIYPQRGDLSENVRGFVGKGSVTTGKYLAGNHFRGGVVDGQSAYKKNTELAVYPFGGGSTLPQTLSAWGRIGVAISANDYMDGVRNRYGIRSIKLLVDGEEVYRSDVDCFSFSENRLINAWTDYAENRKTGRWFIRSFTPPGSSLRFVHTNKNLGIVDINEARIYRFEYHLSDLYGNTSIYRFNVKGEPQTIEPYTPMGTHWLSWSRMNVMQAKGLELVLPRGSLYDDCDLNLSISDEARYSKMYQLGDEELPLHHLCSLAVEVKAPYIPDVSKYYIAASVGKWKGSLGGKFENGWIKTRINNMGMKLWVDVDSLPPVVEPIGRKYWLSKGKIVFRLKDEQTGIHSYKGYIDENFVLFEYSSKSKLLTCRWADVTLAKGRSHRLRVEVSDACGNVTIRNYTFEY